MANQVVSVHASGSTQEIAKGLVSGAKERLGDAEPALVAVFGSPAHPLGALLTAAQDAFPTAKCVGATTAGEFTEHGDDQGSAVLWAITGRLKVTARMATGLGEDMQGAVRAAVGEQASPAEGFPHRTGLILLDPLSGNAEEATLSVAEALGWSVPLIGGAAADDLQMVSTSVGLEREAASDALVVAVLHTDKPLGVGVAHGHVPLSKPVTVTQSDGSLVQEIDGRPAWEVWTEQTAARCEELGIDASKLEQSDAIFDYLNRFEAGLALGDEYKVRVPMAREDGGAIRFACGIPEGTVLRVMESVEQRQIASAREAVRRSLESLGDARPAGALVFDCSCRKTILKGAFEEAVAAMADELGNKPLAGFETYGEIALHVGGMSGFHNTTTVFVTFPE